MQFLGLAELPVVKELAIFLPRIANFGRAQDMRARRDYWPQASHPLSNLTRPPAARTPAVVEVPVRSRYPRSN